MSSTTSKNLAPNVRCLNDKCAFFDLMSEEKANDCANTIREQIATEHSVKNSYEEFLYSYMNDSE